MSHFLDRLTYFSQPREKFADAYGVTTGEDRTWEDAYRNRWAHDKIVRSTHGVNCTGSCSWKIYVKGGIVTWETQQTDYPRTRWDMPNHEPRGDHGGASKPHKIPSIHLILIPLAMPAPARPPNEHGRYENPWVVLPFFPFSFWLNGWQKQTF